MEYLGLVAVEPRDVFTIPNWRFPTQQVCDQCGAVLPRSRQGGQHADWHEQQMKR